MAKAHRGRTLKAEKPGSGRGVCPACKRSGVKVLYTQQFKEKDITTCKQCRVAVSRGKVNL